MKKDDNEFEQYIRYVFDELANLKNQFIGVFTKSIQPPNYSFSLSYATNDGGVMPYTIAASYLSFLNELFTEAFGPSRFNAPSSPVDLTESGIEL